MGSPEEEDAIWARLMNASLPAGDADISSDGVEGVLEKDPSEILEHCCKLVAERVEQPSGALTNVLAHAEVDGEKLEKHEIPVVALTRRT